MGWKQIAEISIENITDEIKDDLYPIVTWFEIDNIKLDKSQLIHLFKVTQEIVKYKGEQVETLLTELDELAEKQGLEKAKTHKQYKDRSSVSSTEYENLKEDNERLRGITFEQEQEIDKLKKENVKLSYEINNLEKQKIELQTAVQDFHDDGSSDQSSFEIQSSPEYKNMVESLQKKNKHISKLLNDIEIVEKENKVLREKLENLKDELADATSSITQATQEITALKLTNQHQGEKIELLKQQNLALRTQIEELIKQKEERDLQIDEFSEALDKRIDEWKIILEKKDEEIEELKSKYSKINREVPTYLDAQTNRIPELLKNLQERDDKIEELQKQLEEATKEMNETVTIIEQVKVEQDRKNNNKTDSKLINQLKTQLNEANERINTLRSSLQNTEEDVKVKDTKISELIEQIQKYESGEFGLAEAIANINELKKKITVRDKQIFMLVQTLNRLKTETEQLEEQNLLLRQKCGLSDSPIRTDGIAAKQRKQKQLIIKMQTQIVRLKEEKLEQKLNIRNLNETIEKLMKQITDMGGETNIPIENMTIDIYKNDDKKLEPIEMLDECHNEKLQELVIENEALRKGLHEVLNSIHEQAGQTMIEVKSQILERLIKILDVRNVAGWYTPAMRLQAELHSVQGGNAELRDQLKSARMEIQESNEQLQKAKIETEVLKSQLSKSSEMEFQIQDDNTMKNIEFSEDAFSSARTISKMHPDFSDILNEYNLEKEKNKELSGNIEKLKSQCKNYEEQNDELAKQKDILEKQFEELKKYLPQHYDDTAEKKITANLDLVAQLVTFQRKCLYLENKEIQLDIEIIQLKENQLNYQTTTTTEITNLKYKLEKLEIENDFLKKSIDEMIPQFKYTTLEKQLLDMTLKYRQLVEEINNNNNNNTEQNYIDNIDLLNTEINLLKTEKDDITSQLISLKSRCLNFEEKLKTYEPDYVSTHEQPSNNKLAEIEIKLLSESQRANYFNNLYLVQKEQLNNIEKHMKDIQLENNMLKIKNTELQSNLVDVQNQIVDSISEDMYNECLQKNDELLKNIELLKLENDTLEKQLFICKDEINTYKCWKTVNEQELIGLKHQIVDLQAISDDKATIAKLSFDIEMLRKVEIEYKNKIELLEQEKVILFKQKEEKSTRQRNIENELKMINELNMKNRNLKNIIFSLRHQYLGSVPLLIVETYINNLKQMKQDKGEINKKLETIKEIENEMRITKEELLSKLESTENLTQQLLDTENRNFIIKISDWYQEKCTLVVQELKARRNYEFKELQLQQALTKIQEQNDEIVKLEEQLIRQTDYSNILETSEKKPPIPAPRKAIMTSEISTQTLHKEIQDTEINSKTNEQIVQEEKKISVENIDEVIEIDGEKNVEDYVKEKQFLETQLKEKTKEVEDCNLKILDLQKQVHNLRKDLVLKQEEILIRQKTPERRPSLNEDEVDQDQVKSMKGIIVNLQHLINERDETIRNYETKLKELKDEHSRAAVRMQNEIQKLEAALVDKQQLIDLTQLEEKETTESGTNTSFSPTKTDINGTDVQQKAIDYYIRQVHTLETHIGELHTALHVLDTQLTSSREESVRWRTLADDRLSTMDQLRSRLEEQHQNELATYKKETERWRNEVNALTIELSKVRLEIQEDDINSSNTVHQKNSEINSLKAKITELEKKLQKIPDKSKTEITLENTRKQLKEDYEALKKQFEVIKGKEKEAREEIRNLRGQLIHRPIISGRSDRSNNRFTARETRLQKKISALEEELDETRAKLEHEMAINESRKARNIEGLALWEKQKRWQLTAEKLKEKLKQKVEEYEKLQQSYIMSKNIINRLEREKNTLELRLKSAKGSQIFIEDNRVEILENENAKLRMDTELLKSKLEMCQRHSGGLGAAMLEEKLEAQERKIAILELAAKPGNLTTEIERLQNENNALHKENIRLEATNLELKLDLEKLAADTPRLRDQVEHLQRYVDVLRAEKEQLTTMTSIDMASSNTSIIQNKKITDLEKTLLVMKRVIEKLQAENKRLLATKPQVNRDRKDCEERLKSELYRIRKQYKESLEKITILEQELYDARKHITFLEESIKPEKPESVNIEVEELKAQLKQKNELLEKVKILLHRAAAKEKALDEQVKSLKSLIPSENSQENSDPSSSSTQNE